MSGFKTFMASMITILLGVLEQLNVTDFVPEEYGGIALAAVGLVMAVLRFFTKSPIFQKSPE